VEGNACLPQLLGEVHLDAGAFADDSFDRLEGEQPIVLEF